MIHKGKETQTELEILNVDDKLHDDDYEEFFAGKTFRIGISPITDDVTYELDYF